ncbi:uncharacterized protein MONOS_15586 [Monocercomonoides exilis]|uniref:uncharacterized protein n=1 Tax=Monocercomonoides exilis TaxID=2049356 RepID=UPI00355994D4|nr:hypothetical protein MONOS_15586 [Monocercomonoides exilis]|eukprot:MONOS_15586.1-p1 / transcript=MONOS_15586.1 / gene=MONOS_15586 / organism=Monocercomonoides_exilis_PA203 / gene_product=unspecified product / transcript_product=unspecified product / location=Mono_scaffold01280:8713-9415(-) / protein_length=209 / sequence_SO=supercontig / SO=protein_coding / is_pseudo=false
MMCLKEIKRGIKKASGIVVEYPRRNYQNGEPNRVIEDPHEGAIAQTFISRKKRKVEKDPGLQGAKRGGAGKAFQDGFPGDSGGTPGGERLDDHSGYIECIPAHQSGRTIQSQSVLQLSKSMQRFLGDAIWSERCAQNIYKDNETGSVKYQREVESEACNISGRHSPHVSRRGCIEIDLTGDSPVPRNLGWILSEEKLKLEPARSVEFL